MDPLSIAGIGLGTASLSVQIFAGCVKGYQIFSDATDVPSQYQHLLTRLRIEQTRLLNWGSQVGLLKDTLDTPSGILGLNRNLINDVLLEIQAAFRKCVDITAEYDPFLQKAAGSSAAPRAQRDSSARAALLHRALAIHEEFSRVPSRLKWATIKKGSFGKLVNSLIALNDRIESFLDRNTLENMRQTQMESNLMLVQLTNEVTQLRFLSEALRVDMKLSTDTLGGHNHDLGPPTRKKGDDTVAHLARFKAEAALIERDTLHQAPLQLRLKDISLGHSDPGASRPTGMYNQQPIWLEWRDRVEETRSSVEVQRKISQRVRRLTALLCSKEKSALFRSPSCLGYVCDESDEVPRYALVYRAETPNHEGNLGLHSLRSILNVSRMPPLGERIKLGLSVIESLFYLHAVSWLHKGVTSDNIIFTRYEIQAYSKGKQKSKSVDISSPILSGFDFSRPDLYDEQTFQHNAKVEHDLYRHPDLLQFRAHRSCKSHDIYSLGLVLIEIALWRPIEEVIGLELRRSRLFEVGKAVARIGGEDDSLYANLAAFAGDQYAKVVSRCVLGGELLGVPPGADETSPDVAASMQTSFFENVVQPMRCINF